MNISENLNPELSDNYSFSIDKNLSNQFAVFPNPVKDKLIISKISQNASITVYDMQGKLIKTQTLKSDSATLDLSCLDSGVYILKFTSNDTREKKKIIKL